MNDIFLMYSQQDLVTLGIGIADGSIDYEGIVAWINTHSEN
jgi:hypothetical protein